MRALVLLGAGLALIACRADTDFSKGRQYACDRAQPLDTQCPDGWYCGKEGYCHARNTGTAWQCDGDDDCDDGWRCGVEGVCQDRSVAADYACVDKAGVAQDAFCEQGWRCGVNGRCVDPSGDALKIVDRPSAVERVSPALGGLPEHAAVSYFVNPGIRYPNLRGLAAVRDGQLYHSAVAETYFDGPGDFEDRHALAASVGLPAAASDVAAARDRAYVATSSGVFRHELSNDAGLLSPIPGLSSLQNAQLRTTPDDSEDRALLLAFAGTSLGLWQEGKSGGAAITTVPALDGGAAIITELTHIYPTSGCSSILALADGRLVTSQRDVEGFFQEDGGRDPLRPVWQEVALQPDGGNYGLSIELMREDEYYSFLHVVGKSSSGETQTVVLDYDYYAPDCAPIFVERIGLCAPCPPDALAVEPIGTFGGVYSGFNRCALPNGDGGWREEVFEVMAIEGQCRRKSVGQESFELRTRSLRSSPINQCSVDQFGRWATPRGSVGSPMDHVLSFAPELVAGEGNQLVAASPGTDPYLYTPQMGLVPETSQSSRFEGAVAGVSQQNTWVVAIDGGTLNVFDAWSDELSGPPLIATAPVSSDLASGPFSAGVTPLPDGRPFLVVTAFDSVLGAVLVPDGGTAKLQVRSVPLSRTPIDSFSLYSAPPAADGGVALVSAYAAIRGRTFQVSASSISRWRVQEIELETPEAREVWAEGARGRAGFPDGTVYALGSKLLIAHALPEAEPEAFDFAHVCEQTYALGREGLYRLSETPGSPIGQWVKDTRVDAVLPGNADEKGYGGGKLHATRDQLYVFTRWGTVARIQLEGCP